MNLGDAPWEQHLIMKLIIAIIQPDKLEAVWNAIVSVDVFRLTVVEFRDSAGNWASRKSIVGPSSR